MKRIFLAALVGLAAAGASPIAGAQVSINLGIGVPLYNPPPVIYQARPVYRAPPPVIYRGNGYWGHDRRPVIVQRHDNRHYNAPHRDNHHDNHHH